MTARRTLLCLALLTFAACRTAIADQLVVPQPADRGGPVTVQYRLDRPLRAQGHLEIEWTDTYGRLVDRRRLAVSFADQTDAAFTLDLRRASALRNHLTARLVLNGAPAGEAKTDFIARPSGRAFDDYQIVMWQRQNPAQWAALKRIGVTAGKALGDREGRGPSFTAAQIEPLLDADLRWYVENIATDFYAAYHRWTPGKPNHWLFLETQRRYAENPLDPTTLHREPGLFDAAAKRTIADRLATTVRTHQRYAPLFYNLADEGGIADLSAHWDFDFSPATLAEFRRYLQQRYGSLAALNATWETSFATWDAVTPRTTREVMEQPHENFAAWAEFKAWMDEAYAAAVRDGREAVRRADPKALTAITGGQVPGWGGWNYATLAGAIEAMETGNDGRAFDIARNLDPPLVLLNTLFSRGGDGREEHRLWRQLLRGGRGTIIWDSRGEFVAPDGSLGPRGRAAASYFPELRGGIGALVIQSERQTDPVAVLYSHASFRTRWLLDRRPEGDAWSRRSAEDEHKDQNAWRRSMLASLDRLSRLGISPRIVSSRQIESAVLAEAGIRVLILPHAIALSPAEAAAIRDFVERGGIAIADSQPSSFDHLSRRLPTPALADLFVERGNDPIRAGHGQAAMLPAAPDEAMAQIERLLRQAKVRPAFALAQADGIWPADTEIHRFRNGAVSLLAVHANQPQERATQDPRRFDPRPLRLTLPRPAHLYDLREGRALGHADHVGLTLDPVKPILLALSDSPLPQPVLEAPTKLRQGETATLSIAPNGSSPAATHIYRVDVIDPSDAVVPHYSANLIAPGGRAAMVLPVALNDLPGRWQVRVTDRLSGATTSTAIEVAAP